MHYIGDPLHMLLHTKLPVLYLCTMTQPFDPMTAPEPVEVPLAQAPLIRVVAQVRFPKSLAVEQHETAALFQKTVQDAYPVLREEQLQGFVVDKAGAQPAASQKIWRFSDVDAGWTLSLAPDFLALETTKYTNRAAFIARLRSAVEALGTHVDPKLVDRVGLRYIDRIEGSAIEDITRMVRAELRGVVGTPAGAHVTHALTEALFTADGEQLRARWALLPPNATHDPSAVKPISETSWVLDLDMFRAGPVPFSTDRLIADAERFAARVYTFFRWAVTDEFLRHYGGNP